MTHKEDDTGGRPLMDARTAFELYEKWRHRFPQAPRSGSAEHRRNLLELADNFDAFVFDSFGVLNVGEEPIAGADGRTMARAVRTRGAVDPVFVENLEDLADVLGDVLREGDLVLTMGAGDIGAYAQSLPERLGEGPSLKVHS